MSNLLIEAGVTRVEDAVAAEAAGADRLELNSALALGGITPSWGLMGETIRAVKIPIMVMIRPRAGGFCYTRAELDVMRRDVVAAVTAGAKGVVFGALTAHGEVDVEATRRLVAAAGNAACVFHRAFDLCHDPAKSLMQLVECGIKRVMTSGGAASALEGAANISNLIRLATLSESSIEILPAGGIRNQNIEALIAATGCAQIHAAFRKRASDATIWPENAPRLGAPPMGEHEFEVADAEEIAQMRAWAS